LLEEANCTGTHETIIVHNQQMQYVKLIATAKVQESTGIDIECIHLA